MVEKKHRPDIQENNKSSGDNRQTQEKHICLVQLTRAGDLVQTLMAARQLKEHHPEIKLSLIARSSYASPINFLLEECFDRIYPLNTKNLFSSDDINDSHEYVNQFLEKINSEPIDALINLSFSESSSYLCSLIKSKHKLGPYKDQNNQTIIQDKWSQYLYASVLNGSFNPFSLIDLFGMIIGISPLKDFDKFRVQTNREKTLIAHPFSSLERKMWTAKKWSEVLYKFIKDNPDYKVYVVGSSKDKERADRIFKPGYISKNSQIINSVGKTSLKEVYKLLEKSKLFVGHDSLIGHLASVARTQSLTISLGSVRISETTPYSIGSYVFSPRTHCYPCFPTTACKEFACHSDISYQIINNSLKLLAQNQNLEIGELKENVSDFQLKNCTINRTSISPQGFFELQRLDDNANSKDEIFRTFYRVMWLYYFSEIQENQGFPELTNDLKSNLKTTLEGLSHIYELCEFGMKYSYNILNEISQETCKIERIKNDSQKIDEIDELKNLVKKTYPALSPLIDFSSLAKFNLEGKNLVEMAKNSYMTYNDIKNLSSVFKELIQKTLDQNFTNTNANVSTSERLKCPK